MNAAHSTRRHASRSAILPTGMIRIAALAVVIAGCRDGTQLTDVRARPDLRPSMAIVPAATNGKIAFVRNTGDVGIYLMNPDGSGITQLTAASGISDWSPDGTRLAWGCNGEICVINADGSGLRQITTNAVAVLPDWSPDGTRMVFESSRDGNSEIYVMNADGSGQTRITDDPGIDKEPDWSPDGTKIAFVKQLPGPSQIYVMNADGTAPTQLTNTQGLNDLPHWSPDGSKIVWHSTRGLGGSHLWLMNADGSAPTQLTTTTAALNFFPAWSPDGTKIAFTRIDNGLSNIWVVSANGSGETQITSGPARDISPAWQPLPVVDSDGDGVLDTADLCPGTPSETSVDANGCTPQQSIGLLDAQIDALLNTGTLTAGQAAGLTDKLAAALGSIEGGRSTAACGQLAAFINQVRSLVNSGALSPQTGAALQAAASAIRVQSGC